jgi:hypothetical protein
MALKISTGNYENEEFRLSISQVVDPSLSQDELILEAEELGRKVRSQVYTEAGVEFSVEDNGRVMQVLSKSVPRTGGATTTKAPPPPRAKKPAAKPAYKGKGGGSRVNAEAAALWVALVESTDPRADFFDNRDRIAEGKWKPTAPYFKHKKTDTKLFFSDCPEDIHGYFVDEDGDIHYESVGSFA